MQFLSHIGHILRAHSNTVADGCPCYTYKSNTTFYVVQKFNFTASSWKVQTTHKMLRTYMFILLCATFWAVSSSSLCSLFTCV